MDSQSFDALLESTKEAKEILAKKKRAAGIINLDRNLDSSMKNQILKVDIQRLTPILGNGHFT